MSKSTNAGGGIGVLGVLFLIFLVLKLNNLVNWSWWLVTAPLWAPWALVAVIGAFVLFGCGLAVLIRLVGQRPGQRRAPKHTYYL